ncbi:MAG: hypothetical protein GYA21_07210 [Myxococcales bacterium]|nr:hypothetical protein [Myxococcales bacterium]
MRFPLVAVSLCFALAAGCYYRPGAVRHRASPNVMSEDEAARLIQVKLEPYGFKFVNNMQLQREGVKVEIDGYDRAMRVGFEYVSREAGDFEEQEPDNAWGFTAAEIDATQSRATTAREYFLIIPEGNREEVERSVEAFVERLYALEVLKKREAKPKQELFPESGGKGKSDKEDLLPWEATGDLTKKRKAMEGKEKSGAKDDDFLPGQEDEALPFEKKEKKPAGDDATPPKRGPAPGKTQLPANDEEEEDIDF